MCSVSVKRYDTASQDGNTMDRINILTASAAGFLTFFSPCVLPLLPPYLSFITGMSVEELAGKSGHAAQKRSVMTQALLYVMGFTTVFMLLGATASVLSRWLFHNEYVLRVIGGSVIIVFGVHFIGIIRIPFLEYEKTVHLRSKPAHFFGSYIVGATFGVGWTPCVGPVLGSILTVAAVQQSMVQGITLLFFYSLGLAVPFLIAALGLRYFLGWFTVLKRYMAHIRILTGIVLIAAGILILMNRFSFIRI